MLQVMAEMHYGKPMRDALRQARALEDAAAGALASQAQRPN